MEITRAYVKSILPHRDPEGHKGTFGKVYCLCGAVGYTGAPVLAASAAVRSGSGLVFLGVPEDIWPIVAVKCDSAKPSPLPSQQGKLALAAEDAVRARIDGCDAVLIGCGMGRSEESDALTRRLIDMDKPLVLDADGLNALQGCTEKLDVRRGRVTILTPHDGEFARLTDRTLREIASSERTELASRFACEHGCVLVLKGHRTRIALPDGRMLGNTSGCSALS